MTLMPAHASMYERQHLLKGTGTMEGCRSSSELCMRSRWKAAKSRDWRSKLLLMRLHAKALAGHVLTNRQTVTCRCPVRPAEDAPGCTGHEVGAGTHTVGGGSRWLAAH